jgi:hypothetical protein
MAGIVPLLLDAIRVQLYTKLITEVSSSDPTKATVVKIGKFQDDPLKDNIYAAISPGDPERLEWADGIVTLESMQNVGFNIDPREVGGGEVWWRRGIVQVGTYFITQRYTETQAITYAHTFLARLENALQNTPVAGIEDTYGERAVLLFVSGNQFSETGGPPNQYIWRGKVWWQVLTERP